jgi:hypothetical protein
MPERLYLESPTWLSIHARIDPTDGYWHLDVVSSYGFPPSRSVRDHYECMATEELADVIQVEVLGRLGLL